jgi:hypothetical protein
MSDIQNVAAGDFGNLHATLVFLCDFAVIPCE